MPLRPAALVLKAVSSCHPSAVDQQNRAGHVIRSAGRQENDGAFEVVGLAPAAGRDARVLIDHLGLPSRGTADEYDDVVKLAKLPGVYMKVSSFKVEDKPLVRRVYDAFGPDRLIFGGYGTRMAAFEKATALIDQVFDFAPEPERAKIRGGNAMKLFGFR